MRRLFFLAPMLAFLGLLVYFALPLIRHTDPSLVASPLIDKPAPAFSLPPLPGRQHGLDSADLKGQVQIVNIFASWCVPCRAEAGELMALARDHHVTIRGIAYEDKPGNTETYLSEVGDPYASIGMDSDGRVAIDWGAYGVPETYIIDAEGRIRFKHVAPITEQDIEQTILPALARLGVK
jgi:cytochrome c biogenesis protein CcmG/thiol:disulfide interchange protein DsbE